MLTTDLFDAYLDTVRLFARHYVVLYRWQKHSVVKLFIFGPFFGHQYPLRRECNVTDRAWNPTVSRTGRGNTYHRGKGLTTTEK